VEKIVAANAFPLRRRRGRAKASQIALDKNNKNKRKKIAREKIVRKKSKRTSELR